MCAKRLLEVCANYIKYEWFFLRKILHHIFVLCAAFGVKLLVISIFLCLTLIDHAAGDETVSHIEYRRLTARKRARRGGKTHLRPAVRVKRDVCGNAG